MKPVPWVILFVLVSWGGWPAWADDTKGTTVELDGLKSQTPPAWKEEDVNKPFRVKQFRLPKVGEDKEDAVLIVYFFGEGGGGTAADNIKRWKNMFQPPPGKKIDDVAKVEEKKAGKVPLTYVDIHGTYKDKPSPMASDDMAVLRPKYRMLSVIFDSKKGPYFIRLVGPEETIGHHKKEFDEWLKAFE